MSKYFYHGLKDGMYFEPIKCIEKIIIILNSGGIKSKKLLGVNSNTGYNGLEYISLCRKENIEEYTKYPVSSFFTFIFNNFCFIISDEVDAIKTEYIDKTMFSNLYEMLKFLKENENQRYSDMFDEWQVKDFIPLKYIVGIGMPLKTIEQLKVENVEASIVIDKLYALIDTLNLDVVDTYSFNFVEQYETNKEFIKKKNN